MASNITVEIAADTTKLKTELAVAQAELKVTAAEVRSLAREFSAAGEETRNSLLPQLEAAVEKEGRLRAEAAKLGAEMREQGEASASALARMQEGFIAAGEKAEAFNAKIGALTGVFSKFGELALAGFGFEKLAETFNEVAESGEKLLKLSQVTGLTTEELSGLKTIAGITGTDFQEFSADLTKFSRALSESITDPSGRAANALKTMGVDAIDAVTGKMRPLRDLLQAVADKFASYSGGFNKTALESAVFGRSATDLDEMLRNLAETGLRGAIEQSKALGQEWTGEQAESAKEYEENIHKLELAFTGIANTIVTFYLPALNKISEWFTGNSSESETAAAVTAEYRGEITQLTDKLSELKERKALAHGGDLTGLDAEIARTEKLIFNTQRALDLKGKSAEPKSDKPEVKPGSVEAPLMTDPAAAKAAAKAALEAKLATFDEEIKAAKGNLAKELEIEGQKLAFVKQAYGADSKEYQEELGRRDALEQESAHKSLEARLGSLDAQAKAAKDDFARELALEDQKLALLKSAYGAESREYQEELGRRAEMLRAHNALIASLALEHGNSARDIAKIGLEAQRDALDAAVNAGQITDRQKIAALQALAEQEYAINLQGLEDELRLLDLSVAERQRVNDEILKLQAQHVADMAKLNDDLSAAQRKDIDKYAKDWESGLRPISSAFNTSVDGIITGTEREGQALRRLDQSILLSFVNKGVDTGVKGLGDFLAGQTAGIDPKSTLGKGLGLFGLSPATAQVATAAPQLAATTANTAALTSLTAILAANTGAHAAGTVATSANAAATGANAGATTAHAGIMVSHLGVMASHLGVMIGHEVAMVVNTVATEANTIVTALSGLLGFAEGGDPPIGVPSIVGERGPELFVPRSAGTIVPNHALNRAYSAVSAPVSRVRLGDQPSMRGGDTYGDLSVHNHFNGVGQDAVGAVMSAIPRVAQAIGAHWNRNPSTRPKY